MNKPVILVEHDDGSSIMVHSQGAHLTSWRNTKGEELLYTSPTALYEKGVPIRGGVPIIFPQFGKLGPHPAHGFARVVEWTVKEVRNGVASFSLDVPSRDLQLKSDNFDNETKTTSSSLSSCVVSLLYTIIFNNNQLQLQMDICNGDALADVGFMFAFHTYFSVSDITKTMVNGLNLTSYIDNLAKDRKILPPKPIWTITEETDRIYPNQHCAILLMDIARGRTLHISGVNTPDVVLWNPFTKKAEKLRDLPPDAYKHFVCVEHGVIEKKVTLPPLGTWKGIQCITLLPRSRV